LGAELGRGQYGVVYKATLNGETIACKMLSNEAAAELEKDAFIQEARTMSEIPKHPNVIQLVGFCRGDKICILSGRRELMSECDFKTKSKLTWTNLMLINIEFIGGGDLHRLILDVATQPLEISDMIRFMMEISNGMTHLHQHNIIHRFVGIKVLWFSFNAHSFIHSFILYSPSHQRFGNS
jgi:serine/threonine protein kinase